MVQIEDLRWWRSLLVLSCFWGYLPHLVQKYPVTMNYYISPRFLDKIAVHITKNFLDLPGVRVPLILGIHGRKGEGKTFQCELIFERMGVEVIHITAGELESPDAGDPARLIRLRYREAAELVRVRGRMAVLMINDLDAGAGRFDSGTQYTVNTQLVNGTLMNIADNPTNVQLPGSYDDKPIQRIPILVTGNDFSTLYAPLVRDGRMEKFYWEPDRGDRLGIVGGIFAPDGLSTRDIEQLVDTFSTQSVDFFGALRARIYDEQIANFIHQVGIERVSQAVVNAKEAPTFPKPDFRLSHLMEKAHGMVAEQDRIRQMRLAREYNEGIGHRDHHSALSQEAVKFSTAPMPTPSVQPTVPESNGHGIGVPTGADSSQRLSSDVANQVRNLLSQGYQVGAEYADQRRFRLNSWQSCAPLPTHHPDEAIAQLEACLAAHTKDYVRLIGIDPKVKQRVAEQVIQRP
jgi:ribulose bisphosphate carboxylase small subunit